MLEDLLLIITINLKPGLIPRSYSDRRIKLGCKTKLGLLVWDDQFFSLWDVPYGLESTSYCKVLERFEPKDRVTAPNDYSFRF